MCIILPCIWMFVCKSSYFTLCPNIANPSRSAYCFQIVRYFIVEDFGCYTGYWPSYISIIILFSLPVALAIGTFVYGSEQASCDNLALTYLICSPATAIAFYHLIQNHRTKTKILTSHLVSRNSGLSSSQYYRLMAMSMVIEIWGVVWFSLRLVKINGIDVYPLPSWNALHKEDSTVMRLPLVDLSPAVLERYRLFWWAIPGEAIIFFGVFGTSKDVFS
jgi:pheromone a factor receptor